MRSSAPFHREWGYLSGGRNLFRTIAAAAGALGGAGLVLAVGQAPEAQPLLTQPLRHATARELPLSTSSIPAN